MGSGSLEQGLHGQAAVGVILEKLLQTFHLSGGVVGEFRCHGALEQGVVQWLDVAFQNAVVKIGGLVKSFERVKTIRGPQLCVAHP